MKNEKQKQNNLVVLTKSDIEDMLVILIQSKSTVFFLNMTETFEDKELRHLSIDYKNFEGKIKK